MSGKFCMYPEDAMNRLKDDGRFMKHTVCIAARNEPEDIWNRLEKDYKITAGVWKVSNPNIGPNLPQTDTN